MWRVGVALAFAHLAFACLAGGRGRAADLSWEPGDPVPPIMFFTGGDLWPQALTAYGGALYAPRGFAADGPVWKLIAGGGLYRYLSGDRTIIGAYRFASLMPGWHVRRGDLDLTGYAGLDLQRHALYPADPASRLDGSHAGLRLAADLWWQPRHGLLAGTMAQVSASASTIGLGYSLRAAAGVRVSGVWIGPEAAIQGDTSYSQTRIGLQVTGWRYGMFEYTASSGWADDSDRRSGLYARVGVIWRTEGAMNDRP